MQIGMSQAELARRLDVSRGAPGQWESEYVEPTGKHINALAQILRVSTDWLHGGRNSQTDDKQRGPKMPEGKLVELAGLDPALARTLKLLAEGRREIWQLSTNLIAGAGLLPGDYLIVDREQAPRARDTVLAEVGRELVFRVYFPPYLYAIPVVNPPAAPVAVDHVRVNIRGVVVATHRG